MKVSVIAFDGLHQAFSEVEWNLKIPTHFVLVSYVCIYFRYFKDLKMNGRRALAKQIYGL